MSGYTSNELFKVVHPETGKVNQQPQQEDPHTRKCIEILDDCAEMGVKAVQCTGGGRAFCAP